jgi:hypothetical protein
MPIIDAHLTALRTRNSSIARQAWVLHNPPSSGISNGTLPHVPDVSIHYRCGDNVQGHYGFLPFAAFGDLIAAEARSIYVMSENSARKTQNRKNAKMADKCTSILQALFDFLVLKFPDKAIVMLRGVNVFNDFVRLAHSKQTFCSISTFCLWPAMASSNWAYFPVTNLVAKGNNFKYRAKFVWLTKSAYFVIPGHRVRIEPVSQTINILLGKISNKALTEASGKYFSYKSNRRLFWQNFTMTKNE